MRIKQWTHSGAEQQGSPQGESAPKPPKALGPGAALRDPLVVLPILIGAWIALFIPIDFLQTSPTAAQLVDWVVQVFPAIGSHARYSKFPEITKVYFSVMIPLALVVGLGLLRSNPGFFFKRELALDRARNFPIIFPLTVMTLNLGLGAFMAFGPAGKPYAMLPIDSWRIALAVLGPIFAFGPGLSLCSLIPLFDICRKARGKQMGGANGLE